MNVVDKSQSSLAAGVTGAVADSVPRCLAVQGSTMFTTKNENPTVYCDRVFIFYSMLFFQEDELKKRSCSRFCMLLCSIV